MLPTLARLNLRFSVLAISLFTGCLCPAQEVPTLELKNSEIKVIRNARSDPFLDPVRCDEKGTVYLRTYQYPKPLAAPIHRLSDDGKRLPDLSLTSVQDLSGAEYQVKDFQIASRGDVRLLVASRKVSDDDTENDAEISIVTFDREGVFRARTKLDSAADFEPVQFAGFPDGKILVLGWVEKIPENYKPQKDVSPPVEPHALIFDASGRMVQEVDITRPGGTVRPKGSSGRPDSPAKDPDSQGTSTDRWTISGGGLVVGEDGNAYFLHKTNPASVDVISESGQRIRTFSLPAPSPKAQTWWVKPIPGLRLLVNFIEDEGEDKSSGQTQYFYVVDSNSGDVLYRYRIPSTEGGVYACHIPPHTFVFLGSNSDGFLTEVRALPR
jgi:hypothetical protein